jgi:hypothetical protein
MRRQVCLQWGIHGDGMDGSSNQSWQRTTGLHCVAASSRRLLLPGSTTVDIYPRAICVSGITSGRLKSCSFVGLESVHVGFRRAQRALTFWGRVGFIWGTFKVTQARVALLRRKRGDAWVHEVWRVQHENAGDVSHIGNEPDSSALLHPDGFDLIVLLAG